MPWKVYTGQAAPPAGESVLSISPKQIYFSAALCQGLRRRTKWIELAYDAGTRRLVLIPHNGDQQPGWCKLSLSEVRKRNVKITARLAMDFLGIRPQQMHRVAARWVAAMDLGDRRVGKCIVAVLGYVPPAQPAEGGRQQGSGIRDEGAGIRDQAAGKRMTTKSKRQRSLAAQVSEREKAAALDKAIEYENGPPATPPRSRCELCEHWRLRAGGTVCTQSESDHANMHRGAATPACDRFKGRS